MAPRASWKGYIKLSLVSCPVRLYPAVSGSERISFNQLHKDTHNRINMKPVDPELGLVERSDLVRGYEYEDKQYIIVEDSDLEAVRIESIPVNMLRDGFDPHRIEIERLAAVVAMRVHQRMDAGRRHVAQARLIDRAERPRAVLGEIDMHRPQTVDARFRRLGEFFISAVHVHVLRVAAARGELHGKQRGSLGGRLMVGVVGVVGVVVVVVSVGAAVTVTPRTTYAGALPAN